MRVLPVALSMIEEYTCGITFSTPAFRTISMTVSYTHLEDQRGIGTVEMILILVVLIALVLIFKSKLTSLVNEIFDKITKQSRLV